MPLLHHDVPCRHTILRFHFQANITPPHLPTLCHTQLHTHTSVQVLLCLPTAFLTYSRIWSGRLFNTFILTGKHAIYTSIYQPTNAYIISHKTHLKHFKTLRHVSILSNHHQGALFLAKVILQYSQFNSYLQTRCCGSISCCVVEQRLGVRRTKMQVATIRFIVNAFTYS